ncbi:ATP cone domain-containing protein [Chitinophaga terrae (ex Kim and Jung 2007)]|nr:ATP cone domain-containing protein [Chitinophaga terrae (ex Kim and Jung 2007)]
MEERQAMISVRKSNGTMVPFSAEKIRRSLMRSGTTPELVDEILNELYKQVYAGMPTRTIYKIAYDLLKKSSRPAAGRYRLKQAILELGPSGFPFEQYVAEIFRQAGYSAATNQIMIGHCVTHEVDIYAVKNKEGNIVECKYHQLPGTHCDVKIPLYIQSRFKDIEWRMKEMNDAEQKEHHGWLITNTRITEDATKYASCMGLKLLSWDYPAGKGLKDVVDKSGLYPITCLSTLTRHEKHMLLEKELVLCRTLVENPGALSVLQLTRDRQEIVLAEARLLCEGIRKLELL